MKKNIDFFSSTLSCNIYTYPTTTYELDASQGKLVKRLLTGLNLQYSLP